MLIHFDGVLFLRMYTVYIRIYFTTLTKRAACCAAAQIQKQTSWPMLFCGWCHLVVYDDSIADFSIVNTNLFERQCRLWIWLVPDLECVCSSSQSVTRVTLGSRLGFHFLGNPVVRALRKRQSGRAITWVDTIPPHSACKLTSRQSSNGWETTFFSKHWKILVDGK